MAATFPPAMATSACWRGAPVPSTTVPFLIRTSYDIESPSFFGWLLFFSLPYPHFCVMGRVRTKLYYNHFLECKRNEFTGFSASVALYRACTSSAMTIGIGCHVSL